MSNKLLIIAAFLFSSFYLNAQTTASFSYKALKNSKLQLNYLNNPDLKGSLLYSDESSGGIISFTSITYIESKFGLKLELATGLFNKSVIFYPSPEFIPEGLIKAGNNNNVFQFPTSFFELGAGANLPFAINKKHHLNFSIGAKGTFVVNQTFEEEFRGVETVNANGSPGFIPFLLARPTEEVMNPILSGLVAECMYEFKPEKFSLGIQLGVVGSYTFNPYFSGTIDFIGQDEVLNSEVEGHIRYLALRFGFSYTLKPLEI